MKHCPNPRCPSLAATGFVAEYIDTVGVCADCDTVLMDGAAPEASEVYQPLLQEEQLARMVVAAVFDAEEVARQAQQRLIANDIPAVLQHDYVGEEYVGEEVVVEQDGAENEADVAAESTLDEVADEAQAEEATGSLIALLVRQDDLFATIRILELLADSPAAGEDEAGEEDDESLAEDAEADSEEYIDDEVEGAPEDRIDDEVEDKTRPGNYPATSSLSTVESSSPRPLRLIGLIAVIIIVILGLLYGLGGFR